MSIPDKLASLMNGRQKNVNSEAFDFDSEGVQEQMMIRPIDQADRKQVDSNIIMQWYTMQMVVNGQKIDLGSADGFYTCDGDEITGLVTYRVNEKEMEILCLSDMYGVSV